MSDYIYNPDTGELYHYGVKGMKWGVRRYQNKDGSLTPRGKKHYDNMSGTKLHKNLQKAYNKSKGGAFGKNYGENVTRVKKEQSEREWDVKRRLMKNDKEYSQLDSEIRKLSNQLDDVYEKHLAAVDKGNQKLADKYSLEYDRIEKSIDKVDSKLTAIEQRELKKVGADYTSQYAQRSVAALMDLGFDTDTAKAFTDRMLKEDKYGRAVYL